MPPYCTTEAQLKQMAAALLKAIHGVLPVT
jgi:adenosylmethionine-8-amino-7-oxononanoate aminotransferase